MDDRGLEALRVLTVLVCRDSGTQVERRVFLCFRLALIMLVVASELVSYQDLRVPSSWLWGVRSMRLKQYAEDMVVRPCMHHVMESKPNTQAYGTKHPCINKVLITRL